jgi:hypothetical protein
MKYLLLYVLFASLSSGVYGQSYLLFQKNRYRQARYQVGDVLSFRVKGDKTKRTERIRGFEDSLLVFNGWKLDPGEISDLYADDKTRIWYLLRFKYKTILPVTGVGYLLLDVLNSGQFRSEAVLLSGSLIAAGLLAKWLISERIKIRGLRRLMVIAPSPVSTTE